MSPERWQQIEELFQAALEHAPEARSAFLQQASGKDVALREEVEKLLIADASTENATLELPAQMAAEWAQRQNGLQPNQPLSHYTIVSQLGAGGMGVVYLAEDTRLKRKVALKVLPAQFTQQPDRLRRFEQEAQAVSALNHPNIVTLFDLGRVEQHYFMATEFIDGQTLRLRLRPDERLPLLEALDLTLQICQALAAAHQAGIVHRDIKPENVMVRRDGYVKVLDFGLAKLTEEKGRKGEGETGRKGKEDDTLVLSPSLPHFPSPLLSTEAGIVMGTASYMSPEQARGEKVDARTDIFSLGIVLYEMIAGRTPFVGATIYETIAAILHHEPPPLSEAPTERQAIVSKKTFDSRVQSSRFSVFASGAAR